MHGLSRGCRQLGGKTCGDCENFGYCSDVNVKNVKKDTDYCQWPNNVRKFKLKQLNQRSTT